MDRRSAKFSLLLLGIAVALGGCASVNVSEDDQPLAARVERMRQGPGPSASVDFPRPPEPRAAE